MGEIATHIVERVPLDYFTYVISSGIAFIFLSPFKILFPHWLVNPFSLQSASDFLSSALAIFVCSFIPGTILFFLREPISGNNGLNERIREYVFPKEEKQKEAEKKKVESLTLREKELSEFSKWTVDSYLRSSVEFLGAKQSIISGLIISSEIAFFLNAIFLIATILSYFKEQSMTLVLLLFSSVAVGLIFFLLDKFYYKRRADEEKELILKAFREERKGSVNSAMFE